MTAFDEKVAQKRRVDGFFRRFSGEGGTIVRGHATYDSPDDLPRSQQTPSPEKLRVASLARVRLALDPSRPLAGRPRSRQRQTQSHAGYALHRPFHADLPQGRGHQTASPRVDVFSSKERRHSLRERRSSRLR